VKTVQMTLDEELVQMVDRVARKLGQSRSAFTRDALREALSRLRVRDQENRHRRGYEQHPVADDEFAAWESEQSWGNS